MSPRHAGRRGSERSKDADTAAKLRERVAPRSPSKRGKRDPAEPTVDPEKSPPSSYVVKPGSLTGVRLVPAPFPDVEDTVEKIERGGQLAFKTYDKYMTVVLTDRMSLESDHYVVRRYDAIEQDRTSYPTYAITVEVDPDRPVPPELGSVLPRIIRKLDNPEHVSVVVPSGSKWMELAAHVMGAAHYHLDNAETLRNGWYAMDFAVRATPQEEPDTVAFPYEDAEFWGIHTALVDDQDYRYTNVSLSKGAHGELIFTVPDALSHAFVVNVERWKRNGTTWFAFHLVQLDGEGVPEGFAKSIQLILSSLLVVQNVLVYVPLVHDAEWYGEIESAFGKCGFVVPLYSERATRIKPEADVSGVPYVVHEFKRGKGREVDLLELFTP